jgi:hypothetical protein
VERTETRTGDGRETDTVETDKIMAEETTTMIEPGNVTATEKDNTH